MAAKKASATANILGNRRLVIAALLTVVVLGGAITIAATRSGGGGSPGAAPRASSMPLRVRSVSPVNGAKDVGFSSVITIHLSSALATNWSPPILSPASPGTWSAPNPTTLSFQPSGNYVPYATIHVLIPAARLRAANGASLATSFSTSFTVEGATTLRLQELLAELGYLPVAFVPPGTVAVSTTSTPLTSPSTTTPAPTTTTAPAPATTTTPGATTTASADTSSAMLQSEATVPSAISLLNTPGSFVWRYNNTPSQLSALWRPGSNDVVTEGAVMAFESDHNMRTDGEAGSAVWGEILDAVASRDVTSRPYDYLLVTETLPESLYVWSDGAVIYDTLANTGVAGAATPLGTWPVFLKYTTTTMTGTNPDGTHYKDPGVPWVSYFFTNDAVHGFVRPSYGFPQSDGCVELPIDNAAHVYPLDPYGTLVTVTTGNLAAQLNAPPPSA